MNQLTFKRLTVQASCLAAFLAVTGCQPRTAATRGDAAQSQDQTPQRPAQASQGASAEQGRYRLVHNEQDRRIDVTVDGQPFTAYIYPETIKKPVLFPIHTAKGTPITRGYPLEPKPGERVDHPHHVGLWFNHGDVNGHDFWNNSDQVKGHAGPFGTIRHKSVKRMKSGNEQAELEVTMDWLDSEGKPMLLEETTFAFGGSGNTRTIDRITKLTALDKEVLFKDNKEGVLAIRLARFLEHPSNKPEVFTDASGLATAVPQLNNEGVTGKYRSSEGIEGEEVWSTRGKWMNLTGKTGGEEVSVAILDHPKNPNYPTHWHSRGYGLYSANMLGSKVFSEGKEELNLKLRPRESVTFRHRVVIHSGGNFGDAEVNQAHQRFSQVQ
ncbi:hypothetical protein BH24BAC1_BH24BAC1_09580 [soil metagenome]